ncbi:hypothetical protein [uncultured Shewanella sp.]|uniref:hypothetical protein n=1 Tax=uncultured Shewanella sp. TaxID=173975 RepID=UPI00262A3139|nr:hypothetical protein [uncultured Shewanella sp.]
MKSIIISVSKLKRLIKLARQAQNEYEKAAIYSATAALVKQVLSDKQLPKILTDKIALIGYHLAIYLEYEYHHGYHLQHHALKASDLADELEHYLQTFSNKYHPQELKLFQIDSK